MHRGLQASAVHAALERFASEVAMDHGAWGPAAVALTRLAQKYALLSGAAGRPAAGAGPPPDPRLPDQRAPVSPSPTQIVHSGDEGALTVPHASSPGDLARANQMVADLRAVAGRISPAGPVPSAPAPRPASPVTFPAPPDSIPVPAPPYACEQAHIPRHSIARSSRGEPGLGAPIHAVSDESIRVSARTVTVLPTVDLVSAALLCLREVSGRLGRPGA